eukprot:6049214-Pleurochrysis_carterae.AAC.6
MQLALLASPNRGTFPPKAILEESAPLQPRFLSILEQSAPERQLLLAAWHVPRADPSRGAARRERCRIASALAFALGGACRDSKLRRGAAMRFVASHP